jgi:hypothetical protein
MTDVGPPLGRASDKLADNAVQEFKMAKASPSMESIEKFLCNSCLWPIEANAAASSARLDLRRELYRPILLSNPSDDAGLTAKEGRKENFPSFSKAGTITERLVQTGSARYVIACRRS